MVLGGWYGWAYAKQTIWLNREHLTVYHPTAVSKQGPSTKVAGPVSESTIPQKQAGRVVIERRNASSASDVAKLMAAGAAVDLWDPAPKDGEKIATLSIPSIHLTVPVVQGTSDADLALGAGHDKLTPFPGQGSNVLIAGHRDTVFWSVRLLKKGAHLQLKTPYGTFVYRAVKFQIVSENDVAVLAPTNYETLTLSTCYPFFFIGHAPKRYIVYTRLVSEPKLR